MVFDANEMGGIGDVVSGAGINPIVLVHSEGQHAVPSGFNQWMAVALCGCPGLVQSDS